jgi:hypothetical protein
MTIHPDDGAAKGTVIKLLADVGAACKRYHDERFATLSRADSMQRDVVVLLRERKERPRRLSSVFGCGDVWTWTAIRADTK